jgi:hypothetical protein
MRKEEQQPKDLQRGQRPPSREVDELKKPDKGFDEATYYEGDKFELGGVEFGDRDDEAEAQETEVDESDETIADNNH